MKVLVAQLNPIVGDLDGNTVKILESIEEGKKRGVDLVLFSEMALCGYPPEDLLLHDSFLDTVELHLERIVKRCQGISAVVGLVRRNLSSGEKGLFNSAAVISEGRLLGFQDKCLLPTYDVFDERRYFEPGGKAKLWDFCKRRVAITICEDIWQHGGYISDTRYKEDPVLELAPLKPDVMLNLSSSPYQYQKAPMRLEVVKKGARTLKCPVIMCCQVGANGQIIFDGFSVYVSKEGELSLAAKGFVEDTLEIDLDAPTSKKELPYEEKENLLQALILGVRDYFFKCDFKKGCLGISGGVDSALVAYLAVQALGKENVLGMILPSRYTSKQSVQDAESLANNLGIQTKTISIEPPFTTFLSLLEPHFKGKQADVAEENLQARIRGMILMALSNKHGYIVLSTGNKSEVAVGYATLYGDMCGGLGVIGDVRKTKIYALCHYINQKEGREVIPSSILTKAPSAELRFDQKDSDSLPPYEIVDQVLEGYVENAMSIDEISKKGNIPQETVINLVRMIHAAEYKRRQGPPILRVSKKSFGVGRRYPIVQGWA